MNEMYDDYREGTFIPDIVIKKREDNGHYVATAMGLTVTNVNQDIAVNQLTAKIQEGLQTGTLHPDV